MKGKIFLAVMVLALIVQSYLMYKFTPAVSAVFQNMFQVGVLFFTIGLTLGIIVTCIVWAKVSKKVNAYKRELEKESVASVEASSQVKVLEQKIEVLEKALKQALEK